MTRIFLFLFQAFTIALLTSLEARGASVLAFGDFRGHLEPCGCDPRTDVGGIKRLAAAVTRYRAVSPDVVVVHSGNLFPLVIKDKTEAQGISKSIEIIRPDASLVNETDWSLLSTKEPLPKVPWVLSNMREKKSRPEISEVIRAKDKEIYGYLGLQNKSLVSFNQDLFSQWKKLSKTKSAADRILIFSGTDAELSKVSNTKFFGVIISSNTTKLGIEKGDQEQKDENSLMRSFSSKFLAWSVPFGGTGLLRQGGLELTPFPKTLEASVTSTSLTVSRPPSTRLTFDKIAPVQWLTPGEESGTPEAIVKVFDDVREASRNQFRFLVAQRSKDLPESEFAGAESCASCHRSSYDVWMKSKHATAMISLVNRSRQEDPSCVECHVVGFTAKGGYVSETVSPKLSNVQCENCHGARKAHVENPLNAPKVDAKASCAECHTPPHSPGFDMTSYWKMIEHK